MMEVQGGAVIDQVQLLMPIKHVRIFRSPVHVRNECIEPNDFRCELRINAVAGRGIKHSRTGQKIQREVQANTGAEQIADLFIRLIPPKGRIDFDEHDLGNVETQTSPDFSGNQFSHQRESALSRTAKLENIKSKVVRLNNCRK